MDTTFNQQDLKGVVRRRKGIFIKTFLAIFVVAAAIALYLPPIYRSEVSILTENQSIPQEYVKSAVTDYVSERMQIISQQVMRPDRLMDIIKTYHVYPDLHSPAEKLRQMRKDVQLTPVEVSIVDERTGKPLKATTAFTLSFDGKDPETVQKVADLIAGLYIEEDVRRREKVASSTTDFFEKELENLKNEIATNEEKISQFKTAHIDELPGSIGTIQQTIGRHEQELDRIDTTIRSLREKKIYLEGQLASVDPLMPVITPDGKVASNPQERLKALRIRLIQMRSNFSDKHPDVRALMSEIQELEAQVGNPDTSVEKVKRLQYVQNRMVQLKGELGENHPDVAALSREAEALTREVQQLGSAARTRQVSEQKPDNPAYLTLRAQIFAADSEIAALSDGKKRIEEQLSENRRKASAAPLVEKEYNKLTLDYQSANNKYQELLNKFMTAKIAQQVDLSEQGERFILSQPANLPERAHKPNRLAIILVGLILGLGTALGLAALKENLDQSLRSATDVEGIIGTPVIATVSLFESAGDKRARRSKRLLLAFTMVLVLVCGSFIIDRFLIPLDSVWATLEERLVEMGLPLNRPPAK